ncbi:MAG: NFACT family protein [Christensenellales bacterium]
MAFDGIVCSAVVAELNTLILEGKINKIFEPNKNEIIVGIYSKGKNLTLNINIDPVNYRINLTTHSKPNPKNVYNFCMVLRKHLTGGTIKKVYMNELDRIIYIDIDCYNELNDHITKTLIIELMGKHSNIILINSDGIIIDSLRHLNKLDNSLRDILPGYKYIEIENTKLDFQSSTFDSFYNTTKENNVSKISSAISNCFTGFSKSGVSYTLNSLNIKDDVNVAVSDYKKLYTYFSELLKQSIADISCTEINLSNKKDFYITNASSKDILINFFIDDFYFDKEVKEKFESSKSNTLRSLLEKIRKLSDKLKNIDSKLKECSKMETYKLYGELIISNLYRIPNYNQENITLENYYDNNSPISIPLDSTISPSANAKKFFKKYRKLQNTVSIVEKQKESIKLELDYLDSIVYEINNCTNLDELDAVIAEISEDYGISNAKQDDANKKSKKTVANMPTEYKIDGYTILVGKNNKQNDNLTCKLAKKNDLWFHTKDIHGSHVVLRLDKNKKATDSIIYKCATIAAYYSKAKLSQNVPVDYTFIKYVRKPNGAKPGMVIYTDNKTLYVNPKSPS